MSRSTQTTPRNTQTMARKPAALASRHGVQVVVETATTSHPNALLQMTEHMLDKTCSEPLDIHKTKSRREPRHFFARP